MGSDIKKVSAVFVAITAHFLASQCEACEIIDIASTDVASDKALIKWGVSPGCQTATSKLYLRHIKFKACQDDRFKIGEKVYEVRDTTKHMLVSLRPFSVYEIEITVPGTTSHLGKGSSSKILRFETSPGLPDTRFVPRVRSTHLIA